ncbi:MAG: gamma-glutamyltransferase [Burkholderiales bacterium]|nr:gamma-glutamyltransferase [Burkholderiales bacterium]
MRHVLLFSFVALLIAVPVHGADVQRHAVASAHPLATNAGEHVLVGGGNAFDAAVAVAATLAVVEPFASGLGGGGFFLLHRASDGFEIVVDGREQAPGAATRDMYLDADGKPDARASLDGAKAAGIPGVPAALAHLAARYGSRSLEELLGPAIALAEAGFEVDARYVAAAGWQQARMQKDPTTAAIFLDNGKVPTVGYRVRQPALANTLRAIAKQGAAGFYQGSVGRELIRSVRAGGGIWRAEDLSGYRLVEREPVRIDYRGMRITTAPLPSSGGLVMTQALGILDQFDVDGLGETDRVHLVAEALRRAYQDRSRYLGDGDFVSVPQWLSSPAYARQRSLGIDPSRATPSAALDTVPEVPQGNDTTHFSIVDAAGNRVAATLSVNGPFGAGVVAGDTGVLLNNEMDDFTVALSTSNLYGLTGEGPNIVEPGQRPHTSISPTVVDDPRGVLVLGTPGGSRIISMVLLGILEHRQHRDVDLKRIVGAPRYHHQYKPDRIEIEPGVFSQEWIAALRAKGHDVQEGRRRWGNMQGVFVDRATGQATAQGDPRGKAGVLF